MPVGEMAGGPVGRLAGAAVGAAGAAGGSAHAAQALPQILVHKLQALADLGLEWATA
ncbi:hypothetical protein GCM10010246_55920 [Streptomyces cuspidosporus]|uniref:Uncharacterized protein n=1 Tax=Streptomyces cuspidosporus TaxID=66882 RepID=A0ABN3GR48_9ACTN